jgi:amidase
MKKRLVMDIKTSKAFVKQLDALPYRSGKLSELTFAVKDLFDIAETVTTCGNPTWAKTHPPAVVHAFNNRVNP